MSTQEFSFRARAKALQRFEEETFDLLIIGGGITGAGVARDAASRGLSVALVERRDFAFGTSSRSSKLIHGGLRYLENMEFALVFEALSERALLLKTAPHMVRPLPFYLPVYQGDAHGRGILSLGLWLYDLLALFRAPGFHRSLSKKKMIRDIPFLKSEGLKGGFRYFDASMWDDVLAVETLRAAHQAGAAVANYVEAVTPLWDGQRMSGFELRDQETQHRLKVKARKVVLCTGPWTDGVGEMCSPKWKHWLNPSKGVHLIFDLKRIPIPGAMVMSHPQDGRISFVIPRPDFGSGVVIVGTTDGPTPQDPEKAEITSEDVHYLMALLERYFPDLQLTVSDILSAYVGVRPLVGPQVGLKGNEGQEKNEAQAPEGNALQKVSREHFIDLGPGGSVVVAGGKYTTHRKMAEEIVDFTLQSWKNDASSASPFPQQIKKSDTLSPVNPDATQHAMDECEQEARKIGIELPRELLERYGRGAQEIWSLEQQGQQRFKQHAAEEGASRPKDPEGFPLLRAQLQYAIRHEMVIHLEDFYLRRIPLYAARADHGLPWAEALARVWAQEKGLSEQDMKRELEKLTNELQHRSAWMMSISPPLSSSARPSISSR